MRNESELMSDFKRGDDNSHSYWRERILLEVLMDIRSLLARFVS